MPLLTATSYCVTAGPTCISTTVPLISKSANTLSKIIDLEFYAHLGDIIRGYADPVLDAPENMRECMDEMVRRYLNQAVCPVLMTVGNHDTNAMWYDAFSAPTLVSSSVDISSYFISS